MGREGARVNMEKFAARLMGWLKPAKRLEAMKRLESGRRAAGKPVPWTTSPIERHQFEYNRPSQKALRAAGKASLVAGGLGYGYHKATESPEERHIEQVRAYQKQLRGME